MPELPEVETVVRGLRAAVVGDTIASVWVGPRQQPLKSPPAEIVSTLEGAKIAAVRRMGKHIVVDLASGGHWIVHLGMTGQLIVARPDAEISKHTHLIARLDSGREVRFIDPRMFGKLAVTHEFDPGGIEPLDLAFEEFVPLFRKRQTPIKSALLNQQLLRGVGNIYADEALFRAQVHPLRPAGTVKRPQLDALRGAIVDVLQAGIGAGGATIDDFRHADGVEGAFQNEFLVHRRRGEPCPRCGTPIVKFVAAGRGTYACETCQRPPRGVRRHK